MHAHFQLYQLKIAVMSIQLQVTNCQQNIFITQYIRKAHGVKDDWVTLSQLLFDTQGYYPFKVQWHQMVTFTKVVNAIQF